MIKEINNWMLKFIAAYPAFSYMAINKVLWTMGFFYSIWLIQGFVPTLHQWFFGALYAVLTLPLGYWINTLFFQVKQEKN